MKKCKNARLYKGVHPPKCDKLRGCETCQAIYHAKRPFVTSAATYNPTKFFLYPTFMLEHDNKRGHKGYRSDVAVAFTLAAGEKMPATRETYENHVGGYRNAWPVYHYPTKKIIHIGCMKFIGTNYDKLKKWALRG